MYFFIKRLADNNANSQPQNMTPLDEFYFNQKEPLGSCLIALRDLILQFDDKVAEKWYYRLPCFFHDGQMFCYIWIDKKTQHPYIAFYPGEHLQHPLLVQGSRIRSKVLTINPNQDIPIALIYEIILESITSR